jgi:DNA repair exonuclease SbcCD nuclease subunit
MKGPVRLRSLNLEFRGLSLPFGLNVDEVDIKGAKAEINHDPLSLSLEEPADVVVRVKESSVQEYLERKQPGGLSDIDLKAADGLLYLKGRTRLFVEVSVSAVCRLVIKDKKSLWVQVKEVNVAGVGTKNLVESQIDKINPVLNAEDLPFPVTLETLTVKDGVIQIDGLASPPPSQSG